MSEPRARSTRAVLDTNVLVRAGAVPEFSRGRCQSSLGMVAEGGPEADWIRQQAGGQDEKDGCLAVKAVDFSQIRRPILATDALSAHGGQTSPLTALPAVSSPRW